MPCTGGTWHASSCLCPWLSAWYRLLGARPRTWRLSRTTTMSGGSGRRRGLGGLLWNCSGEVGFRLVWRRKTRRPRTPCGSSANVAATALAKGGYERMWRRAGSTGALGPKRRRGTKTFSFSSISSRTLRPCLQRWLRPGPARLRWLCPGLALLRWLCPRLARLRCLCPSPTSGRSRDTKSSVACFVFGLSKESGE